MMSVAGFKWTELNCLALWGKAQIVLQVKFCPVDQGNWVKVRGSNESKR